MPSTSNQHSFFPARDCWNIADNTTEEILSVLLPTLESEKRRKEVINRISHIIKSHYGTEVLPFGSVPLRTYLPHGDIDLTIFTRQDVEESTALGICRILNNQTREDANFVVKNAQYVPAQVKIVKCIVQNISVDISFTQVAGLSSLCFLEKVDEYIGKNHLFKRSIILIKAWCCYESRILGAQYGLISTYALEILVLYILNTFHSSLNSPLAVLYKFLEYYSTFDTENNCISLQGPIPLKSLPSIGAVTQETRSDLLLSQEYLERNIRYFSVLQSGEEAFLVKHLNLIDPLKCSNNLGRSVHKANFTRIISALAYGFRKLRQILMLRPQDIDSELKKFFFNTLNNNRRVPRPDELLVTNFRSPRSRICDLRGDYAKFFTDLITGHWYCRCTGSNIVKPSSPLSYFLSCLEKNFPHKVLYSRSLNAFVPPFSQTDILRMYNSLMSAYEKEKFREKSAYRLQDKVDCRGGASSYYYVNKTVDKSGSWATGIFTPYGVVEEKKRPEAEITTIHHVKASTRIEISSPDAQNSSRGMADPRGGRNLKPEHQGHLSKSSVVVEHLDASSESNKDGNNISFNISMEDFPLLPISKKAVLKSVQPSIQSQVPAPPPAAAASAMAMEQLEDSEPAPVEESVIDVYTIAVRETPDASDTNKEMLVRRYELDDDKDFPPLCR